MNPELSAAITVALVGIVVAVGYQLVKFIIARIKQVDADKGWTLLGTLEKFVETLVLQAQKEFFDESGEFKKSYVRERIKALFPQIIAALKLTDAQIDLIVERVYEYLRRENLGGRFTDVPAPTTKDIDNLPVVDK